MPSVKRALGLEKKPKESAAAKAQKAAGAATKAKTVTVKDLDQQIKILESATKKLVKAHKAGDQASQSAAFEVKTAAERIQGNLPSKIVLLGPQYAGTGKRLQHIIDETQLIWDEHLVAMTKRKAGNIYMEAGRAALTAPPGVKASGPAQRGALTKLTKDAQTAGFAELGPGDAGYDQAKAIREAGAALGLSPAETAAINTFTSEDYKYINPATANNPAWMIGANPAPDLIDKPDKTDAERDTMDASLIASGVTYWKRLRERQTELAERREEGGLHAGMALQGLMKLEVWPKGKCYRGEVLNKSDFDAKYIDTGKGKFRPKDKMMRRNTISSMSRLEDKAKAFWPIAGPKVPDPKQNILYEMEVTNGRDIEKLSSSPGEREVATLPGAEFEITSTEMVKHPSTGANKYFLVKAKQRK